jgi:hypothetical protein
LGITSSFQLAAGVALPTASRALVAALPAPRSDVLRLAARLRSAKAQRGSKVFLFAPCGPRCAASELVYQTAIALAQIDAAPLLILSVSANRGTFDLPVLSTDLAIAEAAPSGPLAAAAPLRSDEEVSSLASPEFRAFLASARARFTYVLIDSAPLAESSGSVLLASQADEIVLQVTAGKTRAHHIRKTQFELESVGGRLMGTVLTQVD